MRRKTAVSPTCQQWEACYLRFVTCFSAIFPSHVTDAWFSGKRFPSGKCSLHPAKADVLRPVVVFISAALFKLWSNAAQFGIENGDIYNSPDEFARTMLRFQTTLCSPSRDSLVPLPAIKLVTDYFHQAADSIYFSFEG